MTIDAHERKTINNYHITIFDYHPVHTKHKNELRVYIIIGNIYAKLNESIIT